MNRSQYATHRGGSYQSVLDAIKSGRIVEALDDNGDIADAALADRLWAERTTGASTPRKGPRPKTTPQGRTLEQARTRHAAAKVEELLAELTKQRRELLSPEQGRAAMTRPARLYILPLLEAFPALVVAETVDLTGRDLIDRLADLASDLICRFTSTTPSDDPLGPPPRDVAVPTERLTLEAFKRDLEAERIELASAEKAGRVINAAVVFADWADRLTYLRAALVNLPSAVATGEGEFEDSIRREVASMTDRFCLGEDGPDLRAPMILPNTETTKKVPKTPTLVKSSASARASRTGTGKHSVNSVISRVLRSHAFAATERGTASTTFRREDGAEVVAIAGGGWRLTRSGRTEEGQGAVELSGALA
jgi:hypothetical protein